MLLLPALSREEASLLCRLAALNALALGSFGIVAPAAQSLFLGAFDLTLLPRAWLAIMGASAAATVALRAMRRRIGPSRAFAATAGVSAASLLVLLCLARHGTAAASFLLFVWRDVYILVLLETLWTLVNISPLARRGGGIYGWFGAAGTCGTIVTGLVGAAAARRVGTLALLSAMVPVLALIGILAARLPHASLQDPSAAAAPHAHGAKAKGAPSWRLSRATRGILLLVAVGHICLTLLDYQVNDAVQRGLPDADRRTQVMGALHSATNLFSLALQLACGRLLAWAGAGGALAVTPILMGLGLVAEGAAGGLLPLLAARFLVKGTDHSLYRVAKERLYVPLGYREKTDSKALVDIAGSRVAKGAASVALMLLAPAAARRAAWWANVLMVLLWGLAIFAASPPRRRPPAG